MKNLKRFTLAISLSLTTWMSGHACAFWEDPSMYNLFHCVTPLPNAEDARTKESVQFWCDYVGLPVDSIGWSVEYLSNYHFEQDEYSNDLLVALQQQGKTEAIELLRLNCKLQQLINGTSQWAYEKSSPADFNNLLNEVEALKVPQALTRRKTFLKMRCLYRLQDYNACMRLWDSFASKWEECPLRQRMEGYVAGIYYQRKQYDKAIEMYFRLGDDESIQLCINRMLGSSDIEAEYEKNPNSKILGYILEDYANYYYHAITNIDYWTPGSDDSKIWTKVTAESEKMEALCERVVREGKADDLQMWKAFEGFIQMFRGQNDKAYQTFCQAEKLRGNGVVKPLIRHYKLAAALEGNDGAAGFDSYLAQEITYFKEGHFVSEVEQSTLTRLYEYEMQRRLISHIEKRDNYENLSTLTKIMLDPNAKWMLDHQVELPQYRELRQLVLDGGGKDVLAQAVVKYSGLTPDFLNEMLGTKLMRADLYDEAVPYLSMVSLDFINSQGIASYLAHRTLPKKAFQRETYEEYWEENPGLTTNVKLNFCQQVISLRQQIAQSSGDQKAALEYELGHLLFQASPAGDLWALSEYSWSSADNHINELNAQASVVLADAAALAKDYSLKANCYFGLAANPCDNIGAAIEYLPGQPNAVSSQGLQLQAFRWLRQQTDRSAEPFHTCDWLKLDVIERQD